MSAVRILVGHERASLTAPVFAPSSGGPMNGAETLVATAIRHGIEVCFANPGTTEMPLVLALDSIPCLRGILCLHENVATGAADGYGRMAGKPAMCLLHLGPGLGNGLHNLHKHPRAF